MRSNIRNIQLFIHSIETHFGSNYLYWFSANSIFSYSFDMLHYFDNLIRFLKNYHFFSISKRNIVQRTSFEIVCTEKVLRSFITYNLIISVFAKAVRYLVESVLLYVYISYSSSLRSTSEMFQYFCAFLHFVWFLNELFTLVKYGL